MATLAVVLMGCADGFTTDGEVLRLRPVDIVADPVGGMAATTPVVAGTTVCVEASCEGECPAGEDVADCYSASAAGDGELSGPWCLTTTGPGEVTWSFEPATCGQEDLGYVPRADSVTLTVVDGADVEAELALWAEALAPLFIPAEGDFPTDWRPAEGEPLRVLEGASVRLPIELYTLGDAEQVVAWSGLDAEIDVLATSGSASMVDLSEPGWLVFEPEAGDEVSLSMSLFEHGWDLGSVRGVAAGEVSSMEVIGVLNGEESAPLGARAVLRDDDGQPIFGVPVEWTVTSGSLAVSQSEYLPGPDYTLLSDECVRPSRNQGERSATVQASWGDLSDEVEFVWTPASQEGSDEGWVASEDCQGRAGCGCATATPAGGLVALLAGLLAMLGRRRGR